MKSGQKNSCVFPYGTAVVAPFFLPSSIITAGWHYMLEGLFGSIIEEFRLIFSLNPRCSGDIHRESQMDIEAAR
ncbi:MAG: hypothetical protein ACI33P_15830 [Lysinibacillus sp.]